MFAAIALSVISIAALAYAVRVALGMARDRAARLDRIARAVRPAHGPAIRYAAPTRAVNRPGDN